MVSIAVFLSPPGNKQNEPKGIDKLSPLGTIIAAMLLKEWLSGERGRGAALARHLRIPPSMVAKMAGGHKQVPLEHCPYIQSFTAGAVTCEELRPDAAEYFALIRRQAANDPAGPLPPGVAVDRRLDHATAAVYANTLAERRMTAGEG